MKIALLLVQLTSLLTLSASGLGATVAEAADMPSADLPSAAELGRFRAEVEILRGKRFQREVPVRSISDAELRTIVDRELAKSYPDRKLNDLQELLAWLDLVPPKTDLAKVGADLMVDQVAGLYDSETKSMCIPDFPNAAQPPASERKNPSQKKVEGLSGLEEGVVFTHEYVHALEDQYWPMDAPTHQDDSASTDREEAQSFLLEGSATRLMVEALPAESEHHQPGSYFWLWNLLHSGLGETVLETLLGQVWKSPEAKVPGVPEALARSLVMPYSFGYSFCRHVQRDWGLDGLDYLYDHQPVSTEQVMHPEKAWEWRDFPVQVTLPETLPGGGKRLIEETLGEAGIAALLGCQLKSLNRGERLAGGWDGDRAALYELAEGRRLMVWASAWDSSPAAERFAGAWLEERRKVHHAALAKQRGGVTTWTSSDGRHGLLRRDARRVTIVESDLPQALDSAPDWLRTVTFTEPPEDAARAKANPVWLRFNPVFSMRRDGDYAVNRVFGGMVWRQDRNSVGAANRAMLGILGEWHQTSSLNQWRLGWGLVAKHQAEARREMAKTTLLPWGILWSQCSAPLPQAPTNRLSRATSLWGLAMVWRRDAGGRKTLKLLPAGLLLHHSAGAGVTGWHVLGTGFSRRDTAHPATQARLLGIPVYRHSTNR